LNIDEIDNKVNFYVVSMVQLNSCDGNLQYTGEVPVNHGNTNINTLVLKYL